MRNKLFAYHRLLLCTVIAIFISQSVAFAQDQAAKIQEVLALAHKYQ